MAIRKKHGVIAVFFLVIVVASCLYWMSEGNKAQKIDVRTEMEDILADNNSYLLRGNRSRCYWVNPIANGTHYLVEISSYPLSEQRCQGGIIDSKQVVTEEPVNLQGTGCFCGSQCRVKVETSGEQIRLDMEGCN